MAFLTAVGRDESPDYQNMKFALHVSSGSEFREEGGGCWERPPAPGSLQGSVADKPQGVLLGGMLFVPISQCWGLNVGQTHLSLVQQQNTTEHFSHRLFNSFLLENKISREKRGRRGQELFWGAGDLQLSHVPCSPCASPHWEEGCSPSQHPHHPVLPTATRKGTQNRQTCRFQHCSLLPLHLSLK